MGEKEAHFVLIHGASHGGWCWYKIRSLMESCGYKVTCLDLAGSGIHPSDPNSVLTFEDYIQPLSSFFSNLPDNDKVILVGHSSGGMVVTDAIHKFAKKIEMAIYVAATMLKHGFATQQDIINGQPDLSEYGDVAEYMYGLGADEPPTSVIVKPQFQRQILYHMSPLEDSTSASMLLRPGPVRPFQNCVFIEGPDCDSVPRVYIRTLKDRVLKQEQQDAMITAWMPSKVFVLERKLIRFYHLKTAELITPDYKSSDARMKNFLMPFFVFLATVVFILIVFNIWDSSKQ